MRDRQAAADSQGSSANACAASRPLLVLSPHLLPAGNCFNTRETVQNHGQCPQAGEGHGGGPRRGRWGPRSPWKGKGRCWGSPPSRWQGHPAHSPGGSWSST